MESFKVIVQKGFKMKSIVSHNLGYTIHQRNFFQITHGLNSEKVTEKQMCFSECIFLMVRKLVLQEILGRLVV